MPTISGTPEWEDVEPDDKGGFRRIVAPGDVIAEIKKPKEIVNTEEKAPPTDNQDPAKATTSTLAGFNFTRREEGIDWVLRPGIAKRDGTFTNDPTIGRGFSMKRSDADEKLRAVGADPDAIRAGGRITETQADDLFTLVYNEATERARDLDVGDFDSLPTTAQDALIDLVFQNGFNGASKFVKTLEMIRDGDYIAAALEIRDSLNDKQTPRRSRERSELLQSARDEDPAQQIHIARETPAKDFVDIKALNNFQIKDFVDSTEDGKPIIAPALDPHTGRVIPVISAAPERSIFDKVKDYLGLTGRRKTTPLEIEAAGKRTSNYQIRQEVFGSGKQVELEAVVARGLAGLTGGLTDALSGEEKRPETAVGAVAGAGAELTGFIFGPLKIAKGITGSFFAPTLPGLRGTASIFLHGGVDLGLASMISNIIPAFQESHTAQEFVERELESGATGAAIGILFPAGGFIESRLLRSVVTLAVMDFGRAQLSGQGFSTMDEFVTLAKADGAVSKEVGEMAFSYLMDVYFANKVPNMRKQLANLRIRAMDELAKTNPEEAEKLIIGLAKKNFRPLEQEGVTDADVTDNFGTQENFNKVYDAVPEKNAPAKKVEAWYNKADADLRAMRSMGVKKVISKLKTGLLDVSANVKAELLKKGGELGRKAVIFHELIRGSSSSAEMQVKNARADILRGLNKADQKLLDRVVESRRTLQVIKNRAQKDVVEISEAQVAAEQVKLRAVTKGIVTKRLRTLEVEANAAKRRQLKAPKGAEKKAATDSTKAANKKVAKAKTDLRKAKSLEKEAKVEARKFSKIAKASAKRPLKNPGNLSAEEHQAFLDSIPTEQMARLQKAADRYFLEHDRNMDLLLREGLIAPQLHKFLKDAGDYSPRRFIKHIDPDRNFQFEGGKIISVPDSGIKRLSDGDLGVLENDAMLLLSDATARVHRRVARNRANKALLEFAEAEPDNGLVDVTFTEEGVPTSVKAPAEGKEIISVVRDGKTVRMEMPREMAKEWVESDPLINTALANIMSNISGTRLLKFTATGGNPFFAIRNLMRDAGLVFATSKDYSSLVPKAIGQMSIDYKETFKDSLHRRGTYVDYINEGGGMSFLTHQGRLTNNMTGAWGKIQDYMGWVSETSEIWTRLAVRNRAIKNGKEDFEATHTARSYLDFNQGGNLVKAADSVIPFLNARVQATRSLFSAAADNPAVFAWKMSQLGLISSGLYWANSEINGDAWNRVSALDKANNWIVTTPFSTTDENGNERHLFFKIAKDESQKVVSTLFDSMAAKLVGDEVDTELVINTIDSMSIADLSSLPPTLKMMVGYALNKDFWTQEDVWKGSDLIEPWAEFRTGKTAPALKRFGALTGLSPERSGFALKQLLATSNPFVSATGFFFSEMFREHPDLREPTTMEMLASTPGLSSFFEVTNPYSEFAEGIEDIKIQSNTERHLINDEIDRLTREHVSLKKKGDTAGAQRKQKSIFAKLRTLPPEDFERGFSRFISGAKIEGMKDVSWWRQLMSASADIKVKIYHARELAHPDEADSLRKTALQLGIFTDSFTLKYNRLKRKK